MTFTKAIRRTILILLVALGVLWAFSGRSVGFSVCCRCGSFNASTRYYIPLTQMCWLHFDSPANSTLSLWLGTKRGSADHNHEWLETQATGCSTSESCENASDVVSTVLDKSLVNLLDALGEQRKPKLQSLVVRAALNPKQTMKIRRMADDFTATTKEGKTSADVWVRDQAQQLESLNIPPH